MPRYVGYLDSMPYKYPFSSTFNTFNSPKGVPLENSVINSKTLNSSSINTINP